MTFKDFRQLHKNDFGIKEYVFKQVGKSKPVGFIYTLKYNPATIFDDYKVVYVDYEIEKAEPWYPSPNWIICYICLSK